MLKLMQGQMILQGIPFTAFDLEGSTHDQNVRLIASAYSPEEAAERFVIIDFTDRRTIVPLNFLAPDPFYEPYTIVQHMVGVMEGCWPSAFEVGARMKGILETAFSLLASHRLSIGEFKYLLRDKDLCKVLSDRSESELGHEFYDHYRALPGYIFDNWVESSANKVQPLAFSPFLGPALRAASCLNFAEHMDAGRTILIRLNEEHLGHHLRLIGALLLAKIELDLAKRAEHPPLHLAILDEAQEYLGSSIDRLLSRRQKRGCGIVLAHQATTQIDETVFASMLTNMRTRFCFAVGDMGQARLLAKELFPITGGWRKNDEDIDPATRYWTTTEEVEAFARELQRQQIGEAVMHSMMDGRTSWIRVARAPGPLDVPQEKIDAVLASCRARFGTVDDAKREERRKQQYLAGLIEEAKKAAHARALAAANRRRRRAS